MTETRPYAYVTLDYATRKLSLGFLWSSYISWSRNLPEFDVGNTTITFLAELSTVWCNRYLEEQGL